MVNKIFTKHRQTNILLLLCCNIINWPVDVNLCLAVLEDASSLLLSWQSRLLSASFDTFPKKFNFVIYLKLYRLQIIPDPKLFELVLPLVSSNCWWEWLYYGCIGQSNSFQTFLPMTLTYKLSIYLHILSIL